MATDQSSFICKSSLQVSQCGTSFSKLVDCRQALVKSDNDVCVCVCPCEAHATPCTLASLHMSVRGLSAPYLHHNNKQMCRLLSECNIVVSKSFPQIVPDNNALITTFFPFSFTARGNDGEYASFPKRPGPRDQPQDGGAPGARPSSSGCSSLCSVIKNTPDRHALGRPTDRYRRKTHDSLTCL